MRAAASLLILRSSEVHDKNRRVFLHDCRRGHWQERNSSIRSTRNKQQQLIGYPGTMWTENPLVRNAGAAVLTGLAVAAVLRFWEEVANRALLEQVMLDCPLPFLLAQQLVDFSCRRLTCVCPTTKSTLSSVICFPLLVLATDSSCKLVVPVRLN